MAKGKRPAPFRTRKLSLSAPMVLHGRLCGRVGRRRTYFDEGHPHRGWPSSHFWTLRWRKPCPNRTTPHGPRDRGRTLLAGAARPGRPAPADRRRATTRAGAARSSDPSRVRGEQPRPRAVAAPPSQVGVAPAGRVALRLVRPRVHRARGTDRPAGPSRVTVPAPHVSQGARAARTTRRPARDGPLRRPPEAVRWSGTGRRADVLPEPVEPSRRPHVRTARCGRSAVRRRAGPSGRPAAVGRRGPSPGGPTGRTGPVPATVPSVVPTARRPAAAAVGRTAPAALPRAPAAGALTGRRVGRSADGRQVTTVVLPQPALAAAPGVPRRTGAGGRAARAARTTAGGPSSRRGRTTPAVRSGASTRAWPSRRTWTPASSTRTSAVSCAR